MTGTSNPEIKNNIFQGNNSGISCNNGSAPLIKSNTFTNNAGSGISASGSSVPTITENTFDSSSSAIWLDASSSNAHVYNNTFTTQKPGIVVYGGTLPASTTWTKDYPYIVTGTVTVAAGATLTIEPGAIVKFARYTSIQVNGTLIADGNDSSANGFTPIILPPSTIIQWADQREAALPSPGDWDSLYFSTTSNNCLLRHAIVKYGGVNNQGYFRGAININSSSVTAANSELSSNQDGIYITNASPASSIPAF